jgi:MFS family permease
MSPDVLPRSDARRVALIVASAFFMQNLDGAILHTSLPQMASDFAVSPVDLNLGITSYLLATAAFVPLSG